MQLTAQQAQTVIDMLEIAYDESLDTQDMYQLAAQALSEFPDLKVPGWICSAINRSK